MEWCFGRILFLQRKQLTDRRRSGYFASMKFLVPLRTRRCVSTLFRLLTSVDASFFRIWYGKGKGGVFRGKEVGMGDDFCAHSWTSKSRVEWLSRTQAYFYGDTCPLSYSKLSEKCHNCERISLQHWLFRDARFFLTASAHIISQDHPQLDQHIVTF